MDNSYAIVTVRSKSTRLPGKCFLPIVEDISVIQIVIRRAKKIGCKVILATTVDNSDDVFEKIAKEEEILIFRGSKKNKIYRWAKCFEQYNISEGLLVDGDDPTFDFNVGRRALEILQVGDSDLVLASEEMTPGFITYGITKEGIDKLLKTAPLENTDTDVITGFIEQSNLKISKVPAYEEEKTGHNVRLTVDYLEDIEFFRALYARVNYLASSPKIVSTALQYGLEKINWHKHEDFLTNQKNFINIQKKNQI